MLVLIVCVANPDNTGLDLDRVNTVEDLPEEIAQKMIDGGSGRVPNEAELAAYRDALDAPPQAVIAEAEPAVRNGPRIIVPPVPVASE